LEWTRRQPFEPFALVTTDGSRYEVTHPELVMPTLSEVVVGVPGANGAARRAIFVSYFHIVRIEPLNSEPAQPSETNGVG
jgi:hypothetical protein